MSQFKPRPPRKPSAARGDTLALFHAMKRLQTRPHDREAQQRLTEAEAKIKLPPPSAGDSFFDSPFEG